MGKSLLIAVDMFEWYGQPYLPLNSMTITATDNYNRSQIQQFIVIAVLCLVADFFVIQTHIAPFNFGIVCGRRLCLHLSHRISVHTRMCADDDGFLFCFAVYRAINSKILLFTCQRSKIRTHLISFVWSFSTCFELERILLNHFMKNNAEKTYWKHSC